VTATAAAGTLTVKGLRRLSPDELFGVFRDLSAPAVGDLSGVFDGHRLAGGNAKMWAALDDEASVRGRWLGKAYRPIDDTSATGCNVWQKDRRILRHMRFDAAIGRSYYDGRACYVMRYGPYRNVEEEQQHDVVELRGRMGGDGGRTI
jgi:hypothetical protein